MREARGAGLTQAQYTPQAVLLYLSADSILRGFNGLRGSSPIKSGTFHDSASAYSGIPSISAFMIANLLRLATSHSAGKTLNRLEGKTRRADQRDRRPSLSS